MKTWSFVFRMLKKKKKKKNILSWRSNSKCLTQEGTKKQRGEQGGPLCCQTEQSHRTSPHKMNYKLQHSTKIVIETGTEHFSHKSNTTEYTTMIGRSHRSLYMPMVLLCRVLRAPGSSSPSVPPLVEWDSASVLLKSIKA